MTKVLISGWNGTGKSTVCRELITRGLNAIDADSAKEPDLCGWVEKATSKLIERGYPVDYSGEKYDWNWNTDVLASILRNNDNVFLCGNANNAFNFYDRFDKIFILDLTEPEQRRRTMARTEHNYGQDKIVQDMVIERQASLTSESIKRGAIRIDASPSPKDIVNNLLEKL